MKGEESSSKAEQGRKAKEAEHPISRCQNFRTPDFKVRKFRTPQNQGAKSLGQKKPFSHTPTSRCEITFNVRNPFSRCEFPKIQFRTPLWKVRKFSHCAKSSPGTRVPISHTPSSFSHCAKRCAKISHTTVQDAKISHTSFQGANFIVQRGQFSHT